MWIAVAAMIAATKHVAAICCNVLQQSATQQSFIWIPATKHVRIHMYGECDM